MTKRCVALARLGVSLVIFAVLGLCTANTFSASLKIMAIGDSIVARYPGSTERRIVGWGVPLSESFNASGIEFINKAVGGTTSKSFYVDHWRAQNLAEFFKPDVLLIEFGHNDAAEDSYVSPAEYAAYLEKYLSDLRASNPQAIVMLVTPPIRYLFDGPGRPNKDELAPYREAMLGVSQREHLPVVDLFEFSAALLKAGPSLSLEALYSMYPIREGVKDVTHFSSQGARMWADQVLKALCDLHKFSLKACSP